MLMTINEAAGLLRVHRNTIRAMIKRGELRSVKVSPRLIRVYRQDIEKRATNGI